MLSFGEALARLLALAPGRLGNELVALPAASGRILAERVVAPADLPPFDYSAMDGYALAASSSAPSGARLLVRGESAAGRPLEQLELGVACRIFTGARLPLGADAVVKQEDVQRDGEHVVLPAEVRPGANVRRRGEDLALGAVALEEGIRLGPGALGLAASMDRTSLLVARRPNVSILCSGDELRAAGAPATGPGQIAESNGPFLRAAVERLGGCARQLPFVSDDLGSAEQAVAHALRGTDVLLTVGGVSVGDHDVMKAALERAGVVLDFWKVAIKPGKPLCVGRTGSGVIAVGLPGNPASASLVFVAFVAPLLRALLGEAETVPQRLLARVKGRLRRAPGRLEFLRARSVVEAGELVAELAPNQASGAPTSFAWADLLVVVPEQRAEVADGDRLEVFRIADALGG